MIGYERHADLAKEFRVSISTISKIVSESKKKPEVLREALTHQHEKESLMLKLTQEIN
jgi:hypothetical protein